MNRHGEAKAFTWPVRVYYEDTDSGGVVYYANYLKFMERARTEWLRTLGFEQDILKCEHGIVFAVARVCVAYLKPARFNDTLAVGVKILRRGRASLTFSQHITRNTHELLCEGEVVIACLAANNLRPQAIPSFILAELDSGY